MHETSCFDAMGFTFRVGADDPRLIAHVAELFAGLTSSGANRHRYFFQPTAARGGVPRYELVFNGQTLFAASTCERLVSSLVQHVNRRAIEGCERLVLHAGGVECDGVGLVLPGVMEAGKTTLVAGLVRAGFAYLTDEAVALDRETLMIQPYPKPLSIDSGSWPLFPELEPHADLATDEHKAHQWLVPPDAIRPGARGRSCPVGVVVFPRYKAGAETVLEPVGRAAALVDLVKNSFNVQDRIRFALDLLAEVVRPTKCYRLTIGELDAAIKLVSSVAGTTTSGKRES